MSTQPPRLTTYGNLLRWAGVAVGGAVCAAVLATGRAGIRFGDALVLSALASLFRSREITMRRGPDGKPLLSFHPGDSLILIAMLRDGPPTALATALLSMLFSMGITWRAWFPSRALRTAATILYYPALVWLGAVVYGALGGRSIRTIQDSGLFFQDPGSVILPLLGMLLVCNEAVNRTYQAAVMHCLAGVPFRKAFLDPLFSLFDYVETLAGLLILVLWTAWGWATLPFTLLNGFALLMSARAYFQHLDARRAAESDPLTGLASWRGLEIGLRRRTEAGPGQTRFALLYLDVDNLKTVNDRFGHKAGDDLLRLVAETCRSLARQRDMVGRRGGDEFLVALNDLTRAEAEGVADRLRKAIAARTAADSRYEQAAAGASVGVAVFPADGLDPQTLIEAADRQMYADKRQRKAAGMAVVHDSRESRPASQVA